MARTRFAAHPLVVAVAFGFLTPSAAAFADDGKEDPKDDPIADPSEDFDEELVAELASSAVAIDPAEFARIEAEWVVARNIVVS